MRTITLANGTTRVRLETWGEIASHLGVEVRTAQRWEKRMGIPIRRLEGGQAVFAFVDELDQWMDKKQVAPIVRDEIESRLPVQTSSASELKANEPTPANLEPLVGDTRHWVWAGGIVAVAGFVLVGLAFAPTRFSPSRELSSLSLEGRHLVAKDSSGRAIWTHEFGSQTKQIDTAYRYSIESSWWERIDVDADGRDEIIAVVVHPTREQDERETIYAFSLDGQQKFAYTPDFAVRFEQGVFDGPWRVWDIEAVPEDRSVWLSLESKQWWPSAVVRIDVSGNATLRFVQPGLVRTLDSFSEGGKTYLLIGGVNNEYASASLALLDTAALPATAPQKGLGPFTCIKCPTGTPEKYLLFPQSPLNIAVGLPYNQTIQLNASKSAITVGSLEALGDNVAALVLFRLSRDLQPLSATPSDAYWSWKPNVDFSWPGRLGHPATVVVRRWESNLWTDLTVPVAGAATRVK